MLFNSYVFIFGFLPAVLLGYILIFKYLDGRHYAVWLSLSSIFFYGWWNPRYVPLLLGSILVNFTLGRLLQSAAGRRRGLLIFAVAVNLMLLGIFKYTAFALTTFSALTDIKLSVPAITLPLGISFFTFTQIAFLVDSYQRKADEPRFSHYTLFVTYFPHLIAGPILHHKEMMSQFARKTAAGFSSEDFCVGLSLFVFGLFKKVVIADSLSPFVGRVFATAGQGANLTVWEAWGAALAYTMQIYFDFSGYSEMALGLSRLFGIQLPANFNSPYKSADIIEFWRNWHMTLSRFLRDYLYIALGGNRHGPVRRYVNLLLTMLLGGLWHGAGWTFVIWGALHGCYLCINHFWRWVKSKLTWALPGGAIVARLLTFIAVLFAWVFFRAENLGTATSIIRSMSGLNGFSLPMQLNGLLRAPAAAVGLAFGPVWPNVPWELNPNAVITMSVALLFVVWLLPNPVQIMRAWKPAIDTEAFPASSLAWRPTGYWAVLMALLAAAALIKMTLSAPTEFLYFQF